MCIALGTLFGGTRETQNAIANGDTRTLSIYYTHTKEAATITFKRNGSYDRAALKQLNWMLRDWRRNEPTNMDPRLFDLVWEVHREVGSREAIHVVSAYRAPATNAMLRRSSGGVAEHSQHMLGKAMDFYLPDVPVARIRTVGVRLQRGGVGFYPTSFNPFVHLDVASVRAWPRLTHDQLARIFPTGKTVHVPANGRPLEGYEEAKAEILARGGTVAGYTAFAASGETAPKKSFFARLFGLADESEDLADANAAPPPPRTRPTAVARAPEPERANPNDPNLVGFFGGGNRQQVASRDTAPAPQAVAALQPQEMSRQETARDDAAREEQAQPPAPAMAPLPVARPVLEQPAQPPAEETAPVAVASMPLPPRRPGDLAPAQPEAEAEVMTVASAAPLPPIRPVDFVVGGPQQTALLRPAVADSGAAALAELAARGGAPASALLPPERPAALAYAAPEAEVVAPRPVAALSAPTRTASAPSSIAPLAPAKAPAPARSAAPLPARIASVYASTTTFASDTVRSDAAPVGNGLTASALVAAARPKAQQPAAPAQAASQGSSQTSSQASSLAAPAADSRKPAQPSMFQAPVGFSGNIGVPPVTGFTLGMNEPRGFR